MVRVIGAGNRFAHYSEQEWREAYRRAAIELGLPPRGPRGSAANKLRSRMALKVAYRANQILWLQKANDRVESR